MVFLKLPTAALLAAAVLLPQPRLAPDVSARSTAEKVAREAAARAVAIVVHPDNPISDLSLFELRDYVTLARQRWPGGARVVVFLRRSTTPEMRSLLRRVYRRSPSALRRYWVKKLYQGRIPAIPSTLRTCRGTAAAVRKFPGAISFLRADRVPDGVKVLRIDGKLPADRGYPLTIESARGTP